MDSANIAARFSKNAAACPEQTALIVLTPDNNAQRYTYKQLEESSNACAAGLLKAGVGKGMRVVLMVMPGLDFFSLAFALFKLGAVLVGVDPGMGVRNLGKCLAEAEPAAFIGNRKAHMARRLLGWARQTLHIKITTERLPLQGSIIGLDRIRSMAAGVQTPLIETRDDDMAAILFTSGSTGVPKGAVYSHANFNAQVAALEKTFAIKPGEIDLATFPLFALFAPVMGMTSIIPAMDFTRPGSVDPEGIINAVNSYGATSMFGSPALLNRVGVWGEQRGIKLSGLKRVLSAGAPVAPVVLERFARLLQPGTQIHTPYGATESLPVSSIGSDEVLMQARALTDQGKGICVGTAVAGIDLRIIRITDTAVPNWSDDLELKAGQIGEIVVRGAQVTGSYYNREASTRLAKIHVPGNGFYHRMGDLGYLDEQGRLWFCGRKSQRVTTAAGELYTIPCEAVFNTHPKVYRTALVGVARDNQTIPVLCVEAEQQVGKSEYPVIKNELLESGGKHPHTAMIRHLLFHKGFPVDIRHNAKINRERLAAWAAKRLP